MDAIYLLKNPISHDFSTHSAKPKKEAERSFLRCFLTFWGGNNAPNDLKFFGKASRDIKNPKIQTLVAEDAPKKSVAPRVLRS